MALRSNDYSQDGEYVFFYMKNKGNSTRLLK